MVDHREGSDIQEDANIVDTVLILRVELIAGSMKARHRLIHEIEPEINCNLLPVSQT